MVWAPDASVAGAAGCASGRGQLARGRETGFVEGQYDRGIRSSDRRGTRKARETGLAVKRWAGGKKGET
jgi:hypothetical protein